MVAVVNVDAYVICKNTEVVLVPRHAWSVSLKLFPVVWIFPRSLSVICYKR